MKVKDKVKVKEDFENFEDDILENKAEVQIKVKAKVKGFGVCLVSLGRNASAPERRFVVPKSSCIL